MNAAGVIAHDEEVPPASQLADTVERSHVELPVMLAHIPGEE